MMREMIRAMKVAITYAKLTGEACQWAIDKRKIRRGGDEAKVGGIYQRSSVLVWVERINFGVE